MLNETHAWGSAHRGCERLGGSLAMISSAEDSLNARRTIVRHIEENPRLYSKYGPAFLPYGYWIGLYIDASGGFSASRRHWS